LVSAPTPLAQHRSMVRCLSNSAKRPPDSEVCVLG